MTEANSPNVSQIYSARDDTWGVNFTDGITLYCTKAGDASHIDAMVAASRQRDADHGAHVQAMIDAVRAYEAAS